MQSDKETTSSKKVYRSPTKSDKDESGNGEIKELIRQMSSDTKEIRKEVTNLDNRLVNLDRKIK